MGDVLFGIQEGQSSFVIPQVICEMLLLGFVCRQVAAWLSVGGVMLFRGTDLQCKGLVF